MINNKRIITVIRQKEEKDKSQKNTSTAAERFSMMWQLTLDAWAFKGESLAESRLQRHFVRVLRRES
jgi:hypothetical protein